MGGRHTGTSRHHSSGGSHGGGRSHSGSSSPEPISRSEIEGVGHTASHIASHVGTVFSEALPAAPLERIGTLLAAHLGLVPKHRGPAQKAAVDQIGKALGTALIGSAVAVKRAPQPVAAKPAPSLPFEPPSGPSRTIYLILLWTLICIPLGFLAVLFLASAQDESPLEWIRNSSAALHRKIAARLSNADSAPSGGEKSAEHSTLRRWRASLGSSFSSLRSLF